jgi:hypothetical protein
MKLYESLPESVTVDGKKIKVDLDFRNVLKMMEILGDDNIIPEARAFLAAKCVVKGRIRNPERIISELKAILFQKQKRLPNAKRLTSYDQDAGYIRSAFRQVYGIDLWRVRLHYIEFRELLEGLTEGNKYTEVIGIRARDIPQATKYNQGEIKWLTEAKAAYALEIPEEERQAQYERDVRNVFAVLMNYVQRGDDKNG